ncbi:Aste57867_23307 [Aphanomyces stellatus]|uniref:Aste57867_23307 protein n=1 Tax=Aphanomyces stellatus TaxID=120398 RepID=A0A485LMG5_9STRA|nr:hypothetical protein As57867_023236 [Aphanomyces stellatus]VFT99952.1 Aste57867_23307 [Aphanomyces stellatus]
MSNIIMPLPSSAFATVFLHVPYLFALMTDFQDGIHGDLCGLFGHRECSCLTPHTASLALHPTHHDRRQPLHQAITDGNLALVHRILACRVDLVTLDALHCAIRHQRLDIVQVVLARVRSVDRAPSCCDMPKPDRVPPTLNLDDVAEHNNFELLQFLRTTAPAFFEPWTTRAVISAARHGNLPMLRFLLEVNNPTIRCTSAVLHAAVASGQVDVVTHLAKTYPTQVLYNDVAWAFEDAGTRGALDMIKLLTLTLFPNEPTTGLARAAATAGHVTVLDWLVAHKGDAGSLADWEDVVRAGHVDVLKWMVRVHRWSAAAFVPRMMQWLDAMFIRPIERFCQTLLGQDSAWYGRSLRPGRVQNPVLVNQVELVDYLHAIGHPLDLLRPTNVEVAKVLHAHGVDFTHGHVHVAVGGMPNGGAIFGSNDLGLSRQQMRDGAALLRYMLEHCPHVRCTTGDMDTAAAAGVLEVVQVLHEVCRVECTTTALMTAVRHSHLEVVQYLYEHRVNETSEPSTLLHLAIATDNVDLVAFVCRHVQPPIAWDVAKPKTLAMMECLVDTQFTINDAGIVFVAAIPFGHVELLEKIVQRGCVTGDDIANALDKALRTGTTHLFDYLWTLGSTLWSHDERRLLVSSLLGIVDNACPHAGPWYNIQSRLAEEENYFELPLCTN